MMHHSDANRAAGMEKLVIARSASDEAIHGAASGKMDCFAEPIIGRAFARHVGSQ